MNSAFYVAELNIGSVIARLFLAMLMGGVIGIEREKKGRAAGFRTYILVAVGATMAMMINQYLDLMQTGAWSSLVSFSNRPDASRLGAQVINGVGFLGAGTIIVTGRQEVKGITTAAGLWASACLGLAIGAGFYECAVIGMIYVFFCVVVFSGIENVITQNTRAIKVHAIIDNYDSISRVAGSIRELNIIVFSMDIDTDDNLSNGRTGVTFSLRLPKRENHENILIELSKLPGINAIVEV